MFLFKVDIKINTKSKSRIVKNKMTDIVLNTLRDPTKEKFVTRKVCE